MSDHRRKRIRYRAWHRGTREMDLILGTFADRWVDSMDAADLMAFEALLEEPDPSLFAWIADERMPADSPYPAMIERLRQHRFVDAGPDDVS